MSGTGQAPPGPQGGRQKIDVSLFHTIITSFFPRSWGDSLTSTHLLLLLICLVCVEEKKNQCIHTDLIHIYLGGLDSSGQV